MKLNYYIFSEAYNYDLMKKIMEPRFVDEIMIQLRRPDGEFTAEFGVRWYDLQGKVYPRIEMYGDCWKFLPKLQGFFEEFSCLGDRATREAVVDCLNRLGAEDTTQRK